jgi:hypothetical protein
MRMIQRLQRGPRFRAPWGVALAPQDFGFFSHDLLIGNRFGGTIAAFDVVSGRFLGNLLNADGSPVAIDGLWALEFDIRGNNESADYGAVERGGSRVAHDHLDGGDSAFREERPGLRAHRCNCRRQLSIKSIVASAQRYLAAISRAFNLLT